MPNKSTADTFWWKVLTASVASLVVIWVMQNWPASEPNPTINPSVCPYPTLADKVAAADLVLSGQVFAVIPSPLGAEVIISPLSVFKGELPPAGVRIVARPNRQTIGTAGAEDTEITFASNQAPYLLWLQTRSDGKFNTSRCAGSRLLGAGLSDEERQLLGPGQAVE